jgi:hypothetical protein
MLIRLYGAVLNEAQGELNLYFTIERINIMQVLNQNEWTCEEFTHASTMTCGDWQNKWLHFTRQKVRRHLLGRSVLLP